MSSVERAFGRLLLPPEIVEVEGPVVFLAGPIQGAPDWQSEAIAFFQQHAPQLHVASPRKTELDGSFDYAKQVDWETALLRRAARQGVVLFWLANEEQHTCTRAYAQTSRFELAEWKVRHERDGCHLVVGFDSSFSGTRYARRRLSQDCPNVPLCSSLIETCEQVLLKI